ncbi:MAG: beta-ketoacyl synthase N-terminal-like domain-containing protein [Planctomycetota bacterium]|nr:beta-ketoacyl synthase N-terminal-like domain-containing protein [Planctomycetota bacterium]
MTGNDANLPVVTGIGAVTALGFSVPSNIEAVRENVSGLRALETDGIVAQAGIVSEPRLRTEVPKDQESQLKFLSPSSQLAVNAVAEVVASGAERGLNLEAVEPARKSLYLAQVDSQDWDCHDFQSGFVAADAAGAVPADRAALNKQASRRTKPFFLLESLKNNVYSFVASWLGMMGPNTAVAGLSHAGFPAIDLAVRAIRRGDLDASLVLGAAMLTNPVALYEYAHLEAEREDDEAVHPGDGAGALLLEPRHRVEARGETGLARILGCAATTGAPEHGGPGADTLRRAVEEAVTQSGRERIELVIVPRLGGAAHKALVGQDVFAGGQAVAWRPLMGHLGTATEPVELALACAALAPGHAALLVSTGFYGQAGAIVVERVAP